MPSLAKEIMLKEIQDEFAQNPYAFFASFDGVSVADISDFRRSIESVATRSLLVKHTLAKHVITEKKYDGAEKLLEKQTVVTFGSGEPQVISKKIVEFAKTNKAFVPKGVIFEDKVYDQEFVKQLADLPSREELLVQMLVRMKSPISGLVSTLGQLVKGLVVALDQVRQQKEAQPQSA